MHCFADGIACRPSPWPSRSPVRSLRPTPIPPWQRDRHLHAPTKQAAINQMIGDYHRQQSELHPRLSDRQSRGSARDVVNELERQRIDEQSAAQAAAIAQNSELIFNSPRQRGARQSGRGRHAGRVLRLQLHLLQAALSDMTNWSPTTRISVSSSKEFPVLGPGSTEAAQVAAAVNVIAPERYDEFHLLASRQPAPRPMASSPSGRRSGRASNDQINVRVMDTPEVTAVIEESYILADALGLTGTPSYVLGNEVIVGAVGYDALHANDRSRSGSAAKRPASRGRTSRYPQAFSLCREILYKRPLRHGAAREPARGRSMADTRLHPERTQPQSPRDAGAGGLWPDDARGYQCCLQRNGRGTLGISVSISASPIPRAISSTGSRKPARRPRESSSIRAPTPTPRSPSTMPWPPSLSPLLRFISATSLRASDFGGILTSRPWPLA